MYIYICVLGIPTQRPLTKGELVRDTETAAGGLLERSHMQGQVGYVCICMHRYIHKDICTFAGALAHAGTGRLHFYVYACIDIYIKTYACTHAHM